MAKSNISALVRGAKQEVSEELFVNPLQMLKYINKCSRVAGSNTAALFERVGVAPGKLTFEFFAPYLYNVVEFPITSAKRVSVDVPACIDNFNVNVSRVGGCRVPAPSCSASELFGGSSFFITFKDGCACSSYRFVVTDEYYDDSEGGYVVLTKKVGVDPVTLSLSCWLDLMGKIGKLTEKEQKQAALRIKKDKKIKQVAKKRVDDTLALLGQVSPSVVAQIEKNALIWARQKVG